MGAKRRGKQTNRALLVVELRRKLRTLSSRGDEFPHCGDDRKSSPNHWVPCKSTEKLAAATKSYEDELGAESYS